jgi:secreted trypsin-like serine protease
MLRTPMSLVCAGLLAVAALAIAFHRSRVRVDQPPVLGGVAADYRAAPSLASITYFYDREPQFQCTGTVVAPRLVLTAAHCAARPSSRAPNSASGYEIVTGDVEAGSLRRQVSRVARVLVHPGYSQATGSQFNLYDAALLVLSTPSSAHPTALAGPADAGRLTPGTQAQIAGWAKTVRQQLAPTHRVLAPTIVQADRSCNAETQPERFYPKAEICTADPPAYRTGVCSGDSGGPLIATDHSGHDPVEIGIASGSFEADLSHLCLTRSPAIWIPTAAIWAWAERWISSYERPRLPAVAARRHAG